MIYKRGKKYWYSFIFEGEHIQRSTKQGNAKKAREMEARHRTLLVDGEAGFEKRGPVPTLGSFKERFLGEIRVRCAAHPETIDFYSSKYSGLLRYAPLANARLNRIDEELIAEFIAKMIDSNYERSTVNRHLATLKRALRLASRWNVIQRVPRIELLSGEKQREFVLSRELQIPYLDACPEFLRNWALFAIETGMRRKELRTLEWTDVHLEPVGRARCGFVRVRGTKSRNSKRNLSLTATAQMVLLRQLQMSECKYVFVMDADHKRPASIWALSHAHDRVRDFAQPARRVCAAWPSPHVRNATWRNRDGRLHDHAADGAQLNQHIAALRPSDPGDHGKRFSCTRACESGI